MTPIETLLLVLFGACFLFLLSLSFGWNYLVQYPYCQRLQCGHNEEYECTHFKGAEYVECRVKIDEWDR